MNNLKDIVLHETTINEIIYWIGKANNDEDSIKDTKTAACQSLFPLINIFNCETVVELGTHWGCSTVSLLENCPNIKTLYTIDNYLPYKDTVPPYVEVNEAGANFLKLSARRYFSLIDKHLQKKLRLIYGDTIKSVKKFEDNSIDFLWFDAHLSEDQLEEELKCWYPKVAHGGIVGVHDCGNNGCDMDQVVYDFMDERTTEGNISYFNDTISWIKGHD